MTDQSKWYMEVDSIRELMGSISSPWDEYRNHSGQIALQKWVDVQDFYHGIVIKNEILLLEYLKAPVQSKKVRSKLFKTMGESEYRIEATRRLYNYVSSISSLADHTMRLLKDYEKSKFGQEYNTRLSKITQLDEFAFLRDLRNYAAHYQIPPIGYIIGTNKLIDRKESFLPVIYTGDLFDYVSWSKGSKQFMIDNFPEIELIKLVNTYAQAINGLYVWFFKQFDSIHGKEVKASELIKDRIVKSQF